MHVKVVKKKLDRNNSFNIRQELLVVSWTIVLKYWSNKKCPKYEGCFCLINPSRLLSTPAVPTTTHLYSWETMMPQESATAHRHFVILMNGPGLTDIRCHWQHKKLYRSYLCCKQDALTLTLPFQWCSNTLFIF